MEMCSVSEVIDRISGKWSVGIIVAAARGPIRFTELERTVEGVSRRMLPYRSMCSNAAEARSGGGAVGEGKFLGS